MASVTLTDNQWKALRRYPKAAPAGGWGVIDVTGDVTGGDLTVTWYPQANGAGTAQKSQKSGSAGQQK